MLRAAGASEEAIEAQTRIQSKVLEILSGTADEALVRRQVRDALRAELVALGDTGASRLPAVERQMEPQIRRALTPWSRFFMVHDPLPGLARLRCPILVLNGSTDTQVPAEENTAAIAAALREAGHPDATVRVLPGLNHLFQTSASGAVSEYGKIPETFAPAALEILTGWIERRVFRR